MRERLTKLGYEKNVEIEWVHAKKSRTFNGFNGFMVF